MYVCVIYIYIYINICDIEDTKRCILHIVYIHVFLFLIHFDLRVLT